MDTSENSADAIAAQHAFHAALVALLKVNPKAINLLREQMVSMETYSQKHPQEEVPPALVKALAALIGSATVPGG